MSHDPIANALNVATFEAETTLPAIPSSTAVIPANTAGLSDYNIVKANLETLATKGSTALDELLEVASLSQHPRAYEVVSTLLGTLGNINKQIAEVLKERDKDKPSSNTGGPQAATNIFVGSTADLTAFMESRKKNGR